MLPGPTLIKSCNHCNVKITEATLASGNTFGGSVWSDGFSEYPMLPSTPALVKCPQCESLLWLDELEVSNSLEFYESAESVGAHPYGKASLQDYMGLLDEPTLSEEKEHYLRQMVWWLGNDRCRRSEEEIERSDAELLNLIQLAELMNPEDDLERIMKAEIKRELGQFNEAEALLSAPFDEYYHDHVEQIGALIRQRSSRVVQLRSEGV